MEGPTPERPLMMIHAINHVFELPAPGEGKPVPTNAAKMRMPTPIASSAIAFHPLVG